LKDISVLLSLPLVEIPQDLIAWKQHALSDGAATLRDRSVRLLQRLHANKAELLMVLDRPAIPQHTNGSENDIRCQVTKRQISGGTQNDLDRYCRDAFLSLGKTYQKLGITFWGHLGARLGAPGITAAPRLADLIRCRGQPA
jgi:hypothetical protein